MIQKTAIRYLRISTDKQSHFSIQGQDMRTLEWCERNNVAVIDTFIDEGYSAKTFDRPDMAKLKAFIQKHHKSVNYLVVQELDRFSRDAGEAIVMIKQLQKLYRIQIVGVNEGLIFDYDNPGSFFRTGLQLLLAEDDNIRRSGKINGGIYTAKKKEGRYIGAAPFGYKKVLNEKKVPIMVIDEKPAKIVRFIFDAYNADMPMLEIRKQAAAMGFTQSGNSAITKILTRQAYTSLLTVKAYQDRPEEIVEASHEPIISRTQWLATQQKLKGGTTKVIVSDEMPLRGVLKCHCGKAVTGAASTGRHGGKFFYYKCATSTHLNLSVKKAHGQLMEVLKLMSLPQRLITAIKHQTTVDLEATQKENKQRIKQLAKDLEDCEAKLYSVEEKWIANQLNFESYQRWHSHHSHQRLALNAQLDKLEQEEKHIWYLVQDELEKLSDLHYLYQIGSTTDKQQLIRLGFDSRLYYSGGTYRTPYMMPIFTHNTLIMKEKGLLVLDQQPLSLERNFKSGLQGNIIEPHTFFNSLTNLLLFVQQLKTA